MRTFSAILIFITLSVTLNAQEMLGVISSNYAGIYGIKVNPALTPTSKLYMDFNLLSAQTFMDNNYAFVSSEDMFNLVFKREAPRYYTFENEARNFTINRDNESKFGFYNVNLAGPGGMLVYGKHGFGLNTSFRMISTFNNMPNDIANFLYEAIDFDYQHGINYVHDEDIKIGSISWFEMSLNYAYTLRRYKWDYLTAGINVKPLFGTTGFYTFIDQVDYIVHNDSTATVNSATFDYGISLPINYSDNAYKPTPLIKGYGIAFDIGLNYMFTRKGHKTYYFSRICEQEYEAYNYKIGISLLDVGFIKFSKRAIQQEYEDVSTYWFRPTDTLPNNSVNDFLDKVEYYFNNNTGNFTQNSDFTVNLPTTASLQVDVWIKSNYFINLTVFYPLALSSRSIFYRPSIIAVTPRYETARMEFSLPISFYNLDFGMPRIGFAVRYGNFFMGMDRVNTVLGISDFTGVDFYAGLRLNLSNNFKLNFVKGFCGMRKMYNIETFDYRNF
ncbi:MAG: hypothetical protein KDC05_03040 [Bacteroidales bacterium]|nr:hypothetical protein [Bacteroidales bacterium]